MYKITPPSLQTYKGPRLQQSPISQLKHSETVTEDVLQSSTEQYREQLEHMLDLKPNTNTNNSDLWSTIQSIEKRMLEQEQNLQKVNNEQQEEINKLKNEIKQQKQFYESEIEELRTSSRIQSQKPSNYNYASSTPKNNREAYSYRSNHNEDTQEKLYLQQLVMDLKQQVSNLQQKNYYTPIQSNDSIWEQKYRQLEKQKEAELSIKDQHHIERICNLETQMLNQKQSYENELFALRKILDEKSQHDVVLRNQNQQLQKDLNSYINQFNLLQQQVQQQHNQIQQYQISLEQASQELQQQQQQLQSAMIQLKQQQPINGQANSKLLEMANQLSALTNILEKKSQECEYYKQKAQQIQQVPQIISYRQALTPTRQNIATTSDSIIFPTLNKSQLQQQFQ